MIAKDTTTMVTIQVVVIVAAMITMVMIEVVLIVKVMIETVTIPLGMMHMETVIKNKQQTTTKTIYIN
jgi:hypothetical protein